MRNIFKKLVFLLLLASCKDNNVKAEKDNVNKTNIEKITSRLNSEIQKEEFGYELEDSDEAYVMDDWSEKKKNDYYTKTANLIMEFLSWEGYKAPTNDYFSKELNNQFNIKINEDATFIKIPFCNFEKEQSQEDSLIIFPRQKIISLQSELPLLNKSMIKFYHSKDYQNLDNSLSYNLVINKLIFSDLNESEISKYISDSSLSDLLFCLVVNHHYSRNDRILNFVIKSLISKKTQGQETNIDDIKSLVYKRQGLNSEYIIDNIFLKKIAKIDKNKILIADLLSIAKYEDNQNYRGKIIKTINDAYSIVE